MPTVIMFSPGGALSRQRNMYFGAESDIGLLSSSSFLLEKPGIARSSQTSVANAICIESPQLLFALDALTLIPNIIPTMITKVTISPRDWM
jgi:hypothetical protein